MDNILFKKIKNISSSNVSINGVTLTPNAYLHICKNPAFYNKFMSDITSLYTMNSVAIYDNTNTAIEPSDVWNNIDYNIQVANIYTNEVSITPAIIDESISISGYEKDIICNSTSDITLILPSIESLDLYKTLNIKNLSNSIVNVITSNLDTIDSSTQSTQITIFKSLTIQPNKLLNTWIVLNKPSNDNTTVFVQSTPSKVWGPITNPYGRPCSVDLIDSFGNEFESDINHSPDFSHLFINLSHAASGKAILN